MPPTTSVKLIRADVLEGLRTLPDASIHCCVTSPPYLALRRYAGAVPTVWSDGTSYVLGEEPNLHLYIDHLVEIFDGVRRVLRPDGTFWLNLGDSYQHGGPQPSTGLHKRNGVPLPEEYKRDKTFKSKKQLGMIPARTAIALQEAGWILRQDIIWAKGLSFCPSYSGSVMPESIQDRAVWSHEHLFQFAKQDKYFYDINGCREPYADSTIRDYQRGEYNGRGRKPYADALAQNPSDVKRRVLASLSAGNGRNLRNVWVIGKEPLREAHFAAFPTKLIEPIVKLATSQHGVCPTCLSSWSRNLVKESTPEHILQEFRAARERTVSDTGRGDGYTARKPQYRRRVLRDGWVPGCGCGGDPSADSASTVIPATVLDIFSGSGRAGIAATRLGRSYIGVDASHDYTTIGERLIRAEASKAIEAGVISGVNFTIEGMEPDTHEHGHDDAGAGTGYGHGV